jgi:hypothetical protein
MKPTQVPGSGNTQQQGMNPYPGYTNSYFPAQPQTIPQPAAYPTAPQQMQQWTYAPATTMYPPPAVDGSKMVASSGSSSVKTQYLELQVNELKHENENLKKQLQDIKWARENDLQSERMMRSNAETELRKFVSNIFFSTKFPRVSICFF